MTLYQNLALALAIGLLIGVERGWSLRDEPDGGRVAGLRTFGLLGLAGGIAGLLGQQGQPLVAAAIAVATLAILVIGYRRGVLANGNLSATTAIAALVTFGLGAMATLGLAIPALVAAVAATVLLSQRDRLHGWLRGLTETEIQAVVRFAVIAGAIWPLLPDAQMGPFNAWNPRDLWLVVVLVCGISFAGYVASRRFGARHGVIATAAIGSLYSSTAVTAALSQQLKAEPAQARVFAAGIAVASAVMIARVLVLTALLVPFALPRLALIIGPAGVVALVFVAIAWRAARGVTAIAETAARNPFALLPAIGFAAFVAVLALVVRWAEARYGSAGIAALLAITGAMDVDAAIVTMRGLPQGTIASDLAGMILSLPVFLNTLVKAGIVITTAGWRSGRGGAVPLVAAAAVIPVALLLTF
jgi:uncharacterized membrane protein (DUF4010 family)